MMMNKGDYIWDNEKKRTGYVERVGLFISIKWLEKGNFSYSSMRRIPDHFKIRKPNERKYGK
jgi:hypothetical protein